MQATRQFEQALARDPAAPGEARRALTKWIGTELDSDALYQAKLMASELVTNAVLHGQGRIVLRGSLDEDRLLVEVIDEGTGFEREVRRSEFEDVGGRGLAIVESQSSRWGIHEGTTHVWFELERGGPRLGEESKPEP
ncbi:MAG TPA: ATP-binding protein [Solirubrobacteraceae bacterium]|nr:ATP-binding protein [Solirubrobacteraceae bacterium]